MVKAKRVYDPPAGADGVRVLVMRLWPRGIRKTAVDVWLKELGADLGNLRAWKAGRLDWPEMRRRYVRGLAAPAAAVDLSRLETLARRRTVTVLCACVDEEQCHRGILKGLLARRRPAQSRRASARVKPGSGVARRGAKKPVRGTARRGPARPSRSPGRRSRA